LNREGACNRQRAETATDEVLVEAFTRVDPTEIASPRERSLCCLRGRPALPDTRANSFNLELAFAVLQDGTYRRLVTLSARAAPVTEPVRMIGVEDIHVRTISWIARVLM